MSTDTTLVFTADRVAARVDAFGEQHVHGVFFATGDPERGGHMWSFTRCLEDDEGVCTVREPQQATVYEGIREIVVSRRRLQCEFESAAAGVHKLQITLRLAKEEWKHFSKVIDCVFKDRAYYVREE